jgi:hypothetical protein
MTASATLTEHALTADHGVLVREQAPVWEMVEATICAGAAYSPSFYILLVGARLIGAVGTLTNSQILIVGAIGSLVSRNQALNPAASARVAEADRLRARGCSGKAAGLESSASSQEPQPPPPRRLGTNWEPPALATALHSSALLCSALLTCART